MKKTMLAILIAISFSASSQTQTAQQKAQDSIANQQFFIIGTLSNFQVLLSALSQPGDVTPNQIKSLIEWVSKGAQKLPDQKKETPKKD